MGDCTTYLPSLSTLLGEFREDNILIRVLFLVLFAARLDEESIGRHAATGFVSISLSTWHLLKSSKFSKNKTVQNLLNPKKKIIIKITFLHITPLAH